jgi:hypothetical protein
MMETVGNSFARSKPGDASGTRHSAKNAESNRHACTGKSTFTPPSRTEKNQREQSAKEVPPGEADGIPATDDLPLSRTQANFIEYVLERMLFGVMQEVVST